MPIRLTPVRGARERSGPAPEYQSNGIPRPGLLSVHRNRCAGRCGQARRPPSRLLSKYSPAGRHVAPLGVDDKASAGTTANSRMARRARGIADNRAGPDLRRMPSRIDTCDARTAVSAKPRLGGVRADHRDRAASSAVAGSPSFFSRTIDAAPPRARAAGERRAVHFAALSGSRKAARTARVGTSRAARATAASMMPSAIVPALTASQILRCCGQVDWKTTSRPASKRSWPRSGVRFRVVQHGRAAGRRRVGDDEAAKPQSRLEHFVSSQRFWVAGIRRPSCTTSSSSGRRASLTATSNGGKQLLQQPLAEVDRIAVASAVADVGDEVFRRGDDAARSNARTNASPISDDSTDLRRTSPPRDPIAHRRDVHDRRKRLANAAAASRAHAARRAPQCRVPCCGQPDRLRENRRAWARARAALPRTG